MARGRRFSGFADASGGAMHWSQIKPAQPLLAELGQRRMIEPGVVLVATIRRDGTPRAERDPAVHRRYADAAGTNLGWHPEPGWFHLFDIDIAEVTFLSYDPASGNQHTAMWPPGREFIRRGTTPT